MRWHRKPVLAFVFLLFCLFAFFGSDRFFHTEADSKAIPPIKANFTRLSKDSFAYYAVYDLRNGNMGYPYVRILMITTTPKMRFHCRFRNDEEVPARLYEFSENHQMPFGVYYVNCKVPEGENVYGSIEVSEENAAVWVQVPITYRIEDEHDKMDYQLDYATCVPVLFGEKYTPQRIVEFMELNSLLGSKRVTIYTDLEKLSADQWKVIKYYADIGLMQVVDFRLPVSPGSIWYHGQLAVVSDCLVQNTGVAEFVGFHDLDEFIVPMEKTNVVDELKESLSEKIGSLRISTQYTSSEKMNEASLITLDAFDHGKLDPTFTKCVLRPEMVFEQGIHHTSRVIQDDYKSPGADDKKLRLFHYKKRGGRDKNLRISTIYGSHLQQNFNLVTKYLGV